MRISTAQLKALIEALYKVKFEKVTQEKIDDEILYTIHGPFNTLLDIKIAIREDVNTSDIIGVDYLFHNISGTWIFKGEDKTKEPYPIVKKLWALAKQEIAKEEALIEIKENEHLHDILVAFHNEMNPDENYTGREMTPDEY